MTAQALNLLDASHILTFIFCIFVIVFLPNKFIMLIFFEKDLEPITFEVLSLNKSRTGTVLIVIPSFVNK